MAAHRAHSSSVVSPMKPQMSAPTNGICAIHWSRWSRLAIGRYNIHAHERAPIIEPPQQAIESIQCGGWEIPATQTAIETRLCHRVPCVQITHNCGPLYRCWCLQCTPLCTYVPGRGCWQVGPTRTHRGCPTWRGCPRASGPHGSPTPQTSTAR
jgi:hypothetical protein